MKVARFPRDCSTGFSIGPLAWDTPAQAALFLASLSAFGLRTICPGDSNMRWSVLACATLVAACANFQPTDTRSFQGAGQPAVDERREARALELAESNCVSQGKDVEAGRDEGQTVYKCVRR